MKCFYTNADQLRNKLDELKVEICLEGPDFIFVTEVLPKVVTELDCSSVLYQLDGYSSLSSVNGARGVIIYAKTSLNVSPNNHLNSLHNDGSWCDWIIYNETVLLGAVYRSPFSEES